MKKQNKDWKDKELEIIENMMFKICALTGQHYKDPYWEGIVKGSALDLCIHFQKLLDSFAREMIGEKLKEVPVAGTDKEEELFIGGWNEKRQELKKIAKKNGVEL